MPTRDRTPLGAPTWIELMSSDTERARRFYGELFGWECSEANPDFAGYANFSKDGRLVAGLMPKMEASAPDVWTTYFEVADAAAGAADVQAGGGSVMAGPHPVGDLGHMVVAVDPAGAVFGLWQSGTHTGIGVLDEAGAPNWFELHTRGYEPALDFYRRVLGWETTAQGDSPEFRYTTAGPGEGFAGVMDNAGDLPDGMPSFWTVYLQVDSADDTAAKAVELGGTVESEPVDTPYGRLAVLVDPTGARFSLRQV